MRDFQLRDDLQRVVIGEFALPLGFAPAPGRMQPPVQGYTVAYMAGQDDEPDTYSFHVVVSHERLKPILHRAFDMLPEEVYGIVEIGSRDAYRSTDVFIGVDGEPIPLEEFRRVWERYEPFLLEDGSIAAGANSEEPFIEIFLDQWKGLLIHVPLTMREEVEAMLHEFGLEEVPQTWPTTDDDQSEQEDESLESSQIRSVLDLKDDLAPDIDELLLNLRHDWNMELNIDRESNVDEGGRNLGSTLWHAVVIVDSTTGSTSNGESRDDDDDDDDDEEREDNPAERGAYASIWATAISMDQMEQLIAKALEEHPEWTFGEIFTIDRVAFDERPDELQSLAPNRRKSEVHMVRIEPWSGPQASDSPSAPKD